MTHRTACIFEDFFPSRCKSIQLVWVGRRCKRVNELAQRPHGFVAEPIRSGQRLALMVVHEFVRPYRSIVSSRHQDSVTRDIRRTAIQMCAGMVEIAAVLDSDKIGYLRDVIDAAIEARKRSWNDSGLQGRVFLLADRFQLLVNIVLDPGNCEGYVIEFSRRHRLSISPY